MGGFIWDYESRTVGESLRKYNIPGDWCGEFDACDGIWPILCIRADQICKKPSFDGAKAQKRTERG